MHTKWCVFDAGKDREMHGEEMKPLKLMFLCLSGIVVDLHLGIMCADERQIWMAVKATCLSPQFSRAGSAELSQFAKT
jgi:hypothetical protein